MYTCPSYSNNKKSIHNILFQIIGTDLDFGKNKIDFFYFSEIYVHLTEKKIVSKEFSSGWFGRTSSFIIANEILFPMSILFFSSISYR